MSHYHKPYNFEPVPTMPLPRKQLINLDNTTYYHCISRCVRRAYLCGKDSKSGKSYEHRKQWVENRSLTLSSIYAIDICAYAVMSNHTHLVLNANKAQAQSWSIEEVLHRWHRLHKGVSYEAICEQVKEEATDSASTCHHYGNSRNLP